MKSANTCPFLDSLGLYWMPYSLSSIAQGAILPEKSGLWSVLRRGRLLVQQWGVLGSMGGVSWLLFEGLRLPAQGDYT